MSQPDPAITAKIVAFLDDIGVAVEMTPLPEDTFLPAMTVRCGTLLVDPARLTYPGDLLHEAGHIAVTDPALRNSLETVADDKSEEIAAICWSYAAACAIGLDPGIVFHGDGYRGNGASLAMNFKMGIYLGVHLLVGYGLTTNAMYPAMERWLR
ncbi:hypothetical protein AB5I39_04580 [Sphingomonas sp. MMS24-J45]|uniref:hypothetical protein n=1 Tax=Sphingomonas sp. MMS24-J45 TaxID=3238806 RepID=UPI00384B182B